MSEVAAIQNNSFSLLPSWREIWERVEREEKKLLSVDFLEEPDFLGAVSRNKSKKWYSLRLKYKFDAPRLTKVLGDFSEQDKKIYLRAKNALAQLHRDAEIVFSASETKESFLQMISEMQKFYRYRKRKYEAFQRKVQRVAQIVKEANKVIKKYNSEIVRARRAAKEAERKALAEARYKEVSDRMLKDFFNLKNVTVLDKSSMHRAVLFAHLAEYYNYRNWGPFEGWAVDELILAGVDDNEEQWEIHIDVMRREYDSEYGYLVMEEYAPLSDFSNTTVESAMAMVWGLKYSKIIKKSLRQGDILVIPIEKDDPFEMNFVFDHIFSPKEISAETTKSFSPSPNHTIHSEEEFTVKTVEFLQTHHGKDFKRTVYIIILKKDAVMKHISHNDLHIPAGTYVVTPQLSIYDEQNAD